MRTPGLFGFCCWVVFLILVHELIHYGKESESGVLVGWFVFFGFGFFVCLGFFELRY